MDININLLTILKIVYIMRERNVFYNEVRMKKIVNIVILFVWIITFWNVYANTWDNIDLIIPDELDLTKRYILEEVKNLRIELESLRREMQVEMNKKQIETIDKALSYSANTVNYFFILITLTIMWVWIFWWKSIKDVKNRWSNSFEKEVEKSIFESQSKLQELEKEQIRQSKQTLLDQEYIMKKQESGYLWSQYNREESLRDKFKLLEEISELEIEEETLSIQKEKSHLYIWLEMWEKALQVSTNWLEEFEHETTFILNQAIALLMLEKKDDGLKAIHDLIILDPGLKDDILENELLASVKKEILEL